MQTTYITPLLLLLAVSLQAGIKKETFVRLTQEEINGTLFIHRAKVVDGTIEDAWTINGKPVDASEYEQKYLHARTEELQQELQQREEQQRLHEREIAQQQKFARSARIGIHKRSLHELVATTEQEAYKINDARLMPYRVFNAATYATPEHLTHLSTQVAQAKRLITGSDEELNEAILIQMEQELQGHTDRLREFYRASIKQAINTCDNTQLLKEFLELLA